MHVTLPHEEIFPHAPRIGEADTAALETGVFATVRLE
jgi:hypothetical protein